GISDGGEIASGTDPLDAADPSPAAFLVSYWPLDETDGVTTPDLGPHGYDLVLNAMSGANFVDFDGRRAALFDGVAAILTRIHAPGDELPIVRHDGFTVSLWVNILGAGQNDRRIFSEGSTSNADPLYNLGTKNDGADNTLDLFLRDVGTPGHQFSFGTPLDGFWHHIVVTHNALDGRVRTFIDGVLDREDWTFKALVSPAFNTTSVGGILRAAPSHWVNGHIDDVALWKIILTPDAIADLAAGTSPLDLAGPPFRITDILRDAGTGDVTLTWNSKPGRTYVVRFSHDLLGDPRNWADLTDSFTATGNSSSYTDNGAAGTPVRFYVIEEL
ncbi:MAG TPA: LamG-like jellyroll fold domain-containing protein, partial [Methylomirabilota bacterium]|nr:LamG-like jellyroll fold domain-containing protein [Methylomirabilota bacterium]